MMFRGLQTLLYRHERLIRFVAAFLALSLLAGTISCTIIVIKFYNEVKSNLPDARQLKSLQLKVPSVVVSSDGVTIGELFSEKRYPVRLDQMSQDLRNAFIAAEDAQFFAHQGVDYGGIARAALRYISGEGPKQGGSTITQQLAKTLLLSREKTISRKLKDMLLAIEIEKIMSKSDILELYLNSIFLGNNSYGVEAAARNYFGVSAAELSLAQSSMIAGLTPAPSAYAPTANMTAAKTRQRYVLGQMVRWGMIDAAKADAAYREQLQIFRAQSPNTRIAPFFLEEVKKRLSTVFDAETLESGGMKIVTTLNARLQGVADKVTRRYLEQFGNRRGFRGPVKSHGKDFQQPLRSLLSEPGPENEQETVRAIVVDLNPDLDAAVLVTQSGLGMLLAEDHEWALSAGRSKESGLYDFANILKIGDEVRVRMLRRGTPKRVLAGAKKIGPMSDYVDMFPLGPMYKGIRYFELTDAEQIEGSLLLADAADGAVRVMVGGSDYSSSQFNRAMQAKRQIGSSVKPLYYGYAFDQGFGLASQLDSPPIVLGDWKPENYSRQMLGRTTLLSSLIHSYNVPSIQLFQALGAESVEAHLRRLGIVLPKADLSAALGSGSATLAEVLQAYSPFVRQGELVELRLIDRVEDRNGVVLMDSSERRLLPAPVALSSAGRPLVSLKARGPGNTGESSQQATGARQTHSVLSPEAAYLTFVGLEAAVSMGTGSKARIPGVRVAGKTGTTNGYTDAWFIGMVPGLLCGAWVGFDDAGKSLGKGATGGHFAAPLWREFMAEAIKDYPAGTLAVPETLTFSRMDLENGSPVRPGNSGNKRGAEIPAMEGLEPGSPRLRHALGILGETQGVPAAAEGEGQDRAAPAVDHEETSRDLRSLF